MTIMDKNKSSKGQQKPAGEKQKPGFPPKKK